MTLAHFLYIPGMILLGCVLGYVLGSRASATAKEDDVARAGRKAARDARRRASEREAPGDDAR
jgi:hypothetical protein